MSNPNSRTRELTHALTSGRAKLWVLLVGVNQYQDPQFPALHYSAADCQGLESALTAASYEFPKKQILPRHDFAANPSTLAVVRADLAQIVAEAKPQDTVLFYFSGHGMLESPSQQAVLCLRDTSHTALLETGLRIHELMHSLSICEARQQIVWLDACHSGELIMPGTKVQTLTGHQDTVRALAFAPDGQTLASASWDKTVRLWQMPSGQLLQTFTGHRDRVFTVAFDVDGQTLASGSRDQLIKLWDINRPDAIGTFYGHTDWVLSVAFSSDGKTLASGSRDQTVMLWRQ